MFVSSASFVRMEKIDILYSHNLRKVEKYINSNKDRTLGYRIIDKLSSKKCNKIQKHANEILEGIL